MCIHTTAVTEILRELGELPTPEDGYKVLALTLGYYMSVNTSKVVENDARILVASLSQIALHVWGRENGIEIPIRRPS